MVQARDRLTEGSSFGSSIAFVKLWLFQPPIKRFGRDVDGTAALAKKILAACEPSSCWPDTPA
jgi:hypothetical protein